MKELEGKRKKERAATAVVRHKGAHCRQGVKQLIISSHIRLKPKQTRHLQAYPGDEPCLSMALPSATYFASYPFHEYSGYDYFWPISWFVGCACNLIPGCIRFLFQTDRVHPFLVIAVRGVTRELLLWEPDVLQGFIISAETVGLCTVGGIVGVDVSRSMMFGDYCRVLHLAT